MALFTALGTALGAGLSAAAGTTVAAGTALQAGAGTLGTVLSVAGTGASLYGNIQAGQASREAEQIRNRQMQQTAMRERRAAVRDAMRIQAQARSAGVAQGASEGSGVAGGINMASASAAQRISDTNVNQFLGEQMFAANARMSEGRTIGAIGQGMQSFGTQLVNSAPAIGRIGSTLFGKPLEEAEFSPWGRRTDSAYGPY